MARPAEADDARMTRMSRLRVRLEHARASSTLLLALTLAGVVVAIDALTGPSLSFSFFYVLPLVIVTWRFGRPAALSGSLVAAAVWLAVDVATGPDQALSVSLWNSLIRVGFFLTITGLLTSLRSAMVREAELARVDPLTGLANRRAFAETAQRELARSERTGDSVVIALVDLDGLKELNDAVGHAGGDAALVALARVLAASVRASDVAARLGGDEFVLLFSDPGPGAEGALERVVAGVRRLAVAGRALSCSVGAVVASGGTLEAALEMADAALYGAKRSGKGRVCMHDAR
jgi:diguanylate cyclase (GGDEF)-like protein